MASASRRDGVRRARAVVSLVIVAALSAFLLSTNDGGAGADTAGNPDTNSRAVISPAATCPNGPPVAAPCATSSNGAVPSGGGQTPATGTVLAGASEGTPVSIHIDGQTGNFFGATARLCRPNVDISGTGAFVPGGGNCIAKPFVGTSYSDPNRQDDGSVQISAAPANTQVDFVFRVGSGTQSWQKLNGQTVSLTCDSSNPCALWLQEQVATTVEGTGNVWKHYDVTYAASSTTSSSSSSSTSTTAATTTSTSAPTTTSSTSAPSTTSTTAAATTTSTSSTSISSTTSTTAATTTTTSGGTTTTTGGTTTTTSGGTTTTTGGTTTTTGGTTTTTAGGTTTTTGGGSTTTSSSSTSTSTSTSSVPPVGTSTSLTSSLNPSNFGDSVNFTAKVTQNSGSTTPSGTVQFKIDGSAFGGPVTLSGGQATSSSTNSLGPGTHTVKATYSPSGNFTGSSGTLTQTVNEAGFDHVVTGVAKHQTADGGTWLFKDAIIKGGLRVRGGANVVILRSTVFGGIRGDGGGSFEMCRSNTLGGVRITGASGPVIIGDVDDSCQPNFIMGGVTLRSNTGGIELDKNTIRGGVTLTGNTVQSIFERNNVTGGAGCTGNSPAPTNNGNPNFVRGPETGQCRGL